MSSILGETVYETTGWSNSNIIVGQTGGDPYYCAGCNGSYRLTFTSTSIGTPLGVYGVGFDMKGSEQFVFGTTAYVTYGNGDTSNFALPEYQTVFWGITDTRLIQSIYIGLVDGGTNTDNSVHRMAHDDLTIGNAKNN